VTRIAFELGRGVPPPPDRRIRRVQASDRPTTFRRQFGDPLLMRPFEVTATILGSAREDRRECLQGASSSHRATRQSGSPLHGHLPGSSLRLVATPQHGQHGRPRLSHSTEDAGTGSPAQPVTAEPQRNHSLVSRHPRPAPSAQPRVHRRAAPLALLSSNPRRAVVQPALRPTPLYTTQQPRTAPPRPRKHCHPGWERSRSLLGGKPLRCRLSTRTLQRYRAGSSAIAARAFSRPNPVVAN
jgi:hypothetical protein